MKTVTTVVEWKDSERMPHDNGWFSARRMSFVANIFLRVQTFNGTQFF